MHDVQEKGVLEACFVFRDQISWAMMTTELEQIGV